MHISMIGCRLLLSLKWCLLLAEVLIMSTINGKWATLKRNMALDRNVKSEISFSVQLTQREHSSESLLQAVLASFVVQTACAGSGLPCICLFAFRLVEFALNVFNRFILRTFMFVFAFICHFPRLMFANVFSPRFAVSFIRLIVRSWYSCAECLIQCDLSTLN